MIKMTDPNQEKQKTGDKDVSSKESDNIDDENEKSLNRIEFEKTLDSLSEYQKELEKRLEKDNKHKGDIHIDCDLDTLDEKEADKSKFEDFDEFEENLKKEKNEDDK
jgi:hypothetical protein